MSDDVKMLIICFAPMAIIAVLGVFYFAWQDWLLTDATKKAIDAQKEIYMNMPDKCKECPYCRQKDEEKK